MISASVVSAASFGDVKKYCWLSSSTARVGGTGVGANPSANCLLRFLHDLMTAM